MVREFLHNVPGKQEAEGSAVVLVNRVGTPVQANGSDVVGSSATDVTKYGVRMQGNSIETYAFFSSERQAAAFACDEDQLPQIVLVFAGHLNH